MLTTYDATGTVQSIADGATGALYFERLAFDARGNVTQSRLGNGVVTTRKYDLASGTLTAIQSAALTGQFHPA